MGMFETNSSSVHSLIINQNDKKITIKKDLSNQTIVLGQGEYGWGYQELTTWLEKADYLSIEAYYNDQLKYYLEEAIKIDFPNINITYKTELNHLNQLIVTGYIDHQSTNQIWDNLLKHCKKVDNNKIIKFINKILFNDSHIIITNDNDF
jgi:hypothetical protein